jgi:predicted RecB family nuclease
MGSRITREVLESYLHCKTKAHLKLAGQQGIVSDYEALLLARRQEVRQQAIGKILARHQEGGVAREISLTVVELRQGPSLVLEAILEDDVLALVFDGLKRADGDSKLGDHHYVPILHNHGDKVGRQQKLLLAVLGLVPERVQGLRPATGLIVRGREGRLGKVRLDARLYREAEQVLDEARRLQSGGEAPRLRSISIARSVSSD